MRFGLLFIQIQIISNEKKYCNNNNLEFNHNLLIKKVKFLS